MRRETQEGRHCGGVIEEQGKDMRQKKNAKSGIVVYPISQTIGKMNSMEGETSRHDEWKCSHIKLETMLMSLKPWDCIQG
jgi:hypothetical protein